MIIYSAINRINGKQYIGQTVNSLNRRVINHIKSAKTKDGNYFHNALLKYGKKNFLWKILCKCKTIEDLSKKEKELISRFKTLYPHGYNLTVGGNKSNQNTKGHRLSEGHKRKISKALINREFSEITKQKMSISMKEYLKTHPHSRGMLGKYHSEITKQKISKALMGNQNVKVRWLRQGRSN